MAHDAMLRILMAAEQQLSAQQAQIVATRNTIAGAIALIADDAAPDPRDADLPETFDDTPEDPTITARMKTRRRRL